MQDPKNGDLSYATRRFGNEVHRLYGVMNLGLHDKQWLAAGEYTIADMICYPWSVNWKMRGIDLEEFPNVKRWLAEMEARCRRCRRPWRWGRSSARTSATISDEERAFRRAGILANQRHAWPVPKEWMAAAQVGRRRRSSPSASSVALPRIGGMVGGFSRRLSDWAALARLEAWRSFACR